MADNLKASEVSAIREKVQAAYNGLSASKRQESFNDLLDVMVFFRGLEHGAEQDIPAVEKPKDKPAT